MSFYTKHTKAVFPKEYGFLFSYDEPFYFYKK